MVHLLLLWATELHESTGKGQYADVQRQKTKYLIPLFLFLLPSLEHHLFTFQLPEQGTSIIKELGITTSVWGMRNLSQKGKQVKTCGVTALRLQMVPCGTDS